MYVKPWDNVINFTTVYYIKSITSVCKKELLYTYINNYHTNFSAPNQL